MTWTPPGLPAFAGALWDLRDHASDHPEQWTGVSPEDVFQVMAQIVDRAIDADVDMDWIKFPGLVTSALLRGDSSDTQM
jgi:hypothetical protein